MILHLSTLGVQFVSSKFDSGPQDRISYKTLAS